jgi:hypothetical protein
VGLSLPAEEDALITAVAEVSSNVVVVVTHPGAILLPWADRVAAILCMTVPGQEAGNAAADILFGSVSPSGRLPITLPFGDNDMKMTHEQVSSAPPPHLCECLFVAAAVPFPFRPHQHVHGEVGRWLPMVRLAHLAQHASCAFPSRLPRKFIRSSRVNGARLQVPLAPGAASFPLRARPLLHHLRLRRYVYLDAAATAVRQR